MSTLDRERADSLYNSNSYAENTKNWEDDVSEFRAKAFLDALEAAGLTAQADSILDVGCGAGGVLYRVATALQRSRGNRSLRFKGIDASRNAIGIANRLYGDADKIGVSFANLSTEDLDANERYSVVSLIHVLEHCPDMKDTLDLCARIGDAVYVNVPLEVNLFYTLRRRTLANQFERYGHLHFFDEHFFETWVRSNGYEVLAKVYSSDFEIKKSGLAYALVQWLRRLTGKWDKGFATWLLGGYSLGLLIRRVAP